MSRMPLDASALVPVAFFTVMPIGLSVTFFYRVTPLDHRLVAKGRRLILKYDYERFPCWSAWPGFLPVGIGVSLQFVGRVTEGNVWSLDRLPTDVPQAVMALGLGLLMIGFLFMMRPPRWVLPAWYRTVDAHRKTLPMAAVVMVLDFASEIGTTRASVEAVMARAQAERSGVASSSHQSPAALMSGAVAHLDELTGQVNDAAWFRLVGRGGRRSAAQPPDSGPGFASALAVASDSDWQALQTASDALLARLGTLHDAISRDLPQL